MAAPGPNPAANARKTPSTSTVSSVSSTDQYQHYIPRFILKRFQVEVDPSAQKPRGKPDKRKGKKPKHSNSQSVLFYDIPSRTLDVRPISQVYGITNLYQDISAKDINELEKGLSVLESQTGQIISDLHKVLHTGTFSLKRRDLNRLRKFLFMMHYRSARLAKTYFQVDHPDNHPVRDWIECFQKKHGLKTSAELWLFALRYYMDTPHAQICLHAEQMYKQYGEEKLLSMMETRLDPAVEHYLAFAYHSQATQFFLCFWEAADEAEFILSHESFGLWEGTVLGLPSPTYLHRIFVVSPQVAVVLRSPLTLENSHPLNTDFLDVKANIPTPTYSQQSEQKGESLADKVARLALHRSTPEADIDTFAFKLTKLTKEQTQRFNDVILLNARAEGSLTFSSKDYALQAVQAHCRSTSFWNTTDRPRYEPLIQQLSASPTSISVQPATTAVSRPSVHPRTSFSATVSDMELYETLVHICTGEKQYPSNFMRAHAVFQLVRQSRNSRSTFAAEYRKTVEAVVQRYLARSLPTFTKGRLPPVKFGFRVPFSEARSAQLFTAFEPLMESLGCTAPSGDLLDQVMYQVVVIAFIGWATHDEEVFESVRNVSPALATALSLAEDGKGYQDAIRDQELISAVKKIQSNPAAYGSRYDRARYLFRLSERLENPFSSAVQDVSSTLIEMLVSVLRPPPPGFVPNDRAELIDSLSEEDSFMLFIQMEQFCKRFGLMVGAAASETILDSLVTDAAIINILSWLARNKPDMLAMFLPPLDRITK